MDVYIFDFFGVISSEASQIWYSKLFSEEKIAKIRGTLSKAVDIGYMDDDEFFLELSNISGISVNEIKSQWFNLVLIDEEIINFIKKAKLTHKIVLLSNAPKKFLRNILKLYELESLFDLIIISAEVKMIKPEPYIFQYAISLLDINPENAIFIDDNEENVKAAKQLDYKCNTL